MGWITRRIAGSITFTIVVVLLGSYAALQGWLVGGVSVFTTTGLVILAIAALCSLPGDVSDPHDRHRLLEAVAAHGRIDLLVNNASDLGATPLPRLVEASRETFLRLFEVNTLAPLALVREALPLLRRGDGLVVNI